MAEEVRFQRRYVGALAALLLTVGVAACDDDSGTGGDTGGGTEQEGGGDAEGGTDATQG